MTWQPIETAPSGEIILGWTGERCFIGRRYGLGERIALIDGKTGRWAACTHWMPLPAPPADA